MEILNLGNEKIKACFQFSYKGYIVSCSSIFNVNRVEVGFWLEGLGDITTANTVPEAINAINNLTRG